MSKEDEVQRVMRRLSANLVQFRCGLVWRRVAALTAVMLVAVLAPVVVVAALPAAAAPACPQEAKDLAEAMGAARTCKGRVEVLSARSESAQLFANPDGSQTLEQHAYPQRVRRTDGSWSALDASLMVNGDGSVSPRASVVDMAFSGGGSGALVTVRRAGHQVDLVWPGVLPTPTLSGRAATYSEVWPGVDLVVTAQGTGFSEVLVVKDRKAASNPALRKVAFGTSLKGLRWNESAAGMQAVDANDQPVLSASAPLMWDSSTSSQAEADGPSHSDSSKPGAGAKTAPMKLAVSAGELSVIPDASLLADSSVTYPLFLDPTIGYTAWTMINSRYTTTSYWAYDKTDCGSLGAVECAKVGYYPGWVMYRSLFQFDTAGFLGRQILGAKLHIDLLHSRRCENSVTQLRQVWAAIGPGTTWNNNNGLWSGADTSSVSNNSCSSLRKLTEFGDLPGTQSFTSAIQAVANSGASSTTWGLKAAGETTDAGWKKFDARTAKLIITTNIVPNTPTALTVDGKPCATGPGRPFIKTSTPTLRAGLSDSDGNSMTGSFEWARRRLDGSYGPTSLPIAQGGVPSGSTALVTTPAGVLDNGDEFVATGDWNRDGYQDVLARDSSGYLYLFAGNGSALKPRVQIGVGWPSWDWTIAGVADWDRDGYLDVVVRFNGDGNLYLYPGASTPTGFDGNSYQIGWGFGSYTFAGLADWDRDGHMDLIARDSGGGMWLYPGMSIRSVSSQQPVLLGTGWNGFTYFGSIDWDRDGAPDTIARDVFGYLWLYPGSGGRSGYSGSPYRFEIGSGWSGYSALITPDFNGDGKADIIARPPNANYWLAYPGSGARTYGGIQWTIATTGIADGGDYAFRAAASDGYAWSGLSVWCEFSVDTSNPMVPVVAGDVYRDSGCPGSGCGSVGQSGRFTFSSSPDVVLFKWGFSDPPSTTATPGSMGGSVTIDWTPLSGGAFTLYVKAVDRAGNESSMVHQFFVAPESSAVVRWKLDDSPGSTQLFDDTGRGQTATVYGGGTLGVPGRIAPGLDGAPRTAMRFDGVDDYAVRDAVLDTSRSFTVSAWVKLNAKNAAFQHVLTQPGTWMSPFYLEYNGWADRWAMAVSSSDSWYPSGWRAESVSVPQLGVWTHLAGVYDPAAKTVKLYINGVLESTATDVVAWSSTGQFRLGQTGTNSFNGVIAEVEVWNRVTSPAEVFNLVDPLRVGLVGQWGLEDVGPGPSYDASNLAHDLSFYGGAVIPPSGSGYVGTGLQLDGVDGYAQTDNPVVYTDQSFTVSAWARLPAGVSGNRTVVAQHGNVESGFFLKYEASDGRWYFAYGDADGTTGTGRHVYSAGPAALGVWVHLVGVYDAQTRVIKLFVNGVLQGTGSIAVPWHAPGPLTLGALKWRAGLFEYWSGSIDQVRIYQGAVTDVTRIP